MSFWAKHVLFGPRLPCQAKNALLYRECPIGLRISFLIAKNDNQPYTAFKKISHNRHRGISLLISLVWAGSDKLTENRRKDGFSWISPWVTHGIGKSQQDSNEVRVSLYSYKIKIHVIIIIYVLEL